MPKFEIVFKMCGYHADNLEKRGPLKAIRIVRVDQQACSICKTSSRKIDNEWEELDATISV